MQCPDLETVGPKEGESPNRPGRIEEVGDEDGEATAADGAGDPTEDVGNFVAHLVLRALQRQLPAETGREQARIFLQRYGQEFEPPPSDGVAAVAAATLFRLACLYRFRRRWRSLGPPLLEQALAWARGEVALGDPRDSTAAKEAE